MTCEAWDEIIYPFPNLNGALVEVYQWISYFTAHIIMDVIDFHDGFKFDPCQLKGDPSHQTRSSLIHLMKTHDFRCKGVYVTSQRWSA